MNEQGVVHRRLKRNLRCPSLLFQFVEFLDKDISVEMVREEISPLAYRVNAKVFFHKGTMHFRLVCRNRPDQVEYDPTAEIKAVMNHTHRKGLATDLRNDCIGWERLIGVNFVPCFSANWDATPVKIVSRKPMMK